MIALIVAVVLVLGLIAVTINMIRWWHNGGGL
jgi:hypothetical protein